MEWDIKTKKSRAEYVREWRAKKKKEASKDIEWLKDRCVPADYTKEEKRVIQERKMKKQEEMNQEIEWLFIGKRSHEFMCKLMKIQP